MKTKNMTTLHFKKSIGRSPLRLGLPRVQPIWIIRGFLLLPLVFAAFALSPMVQAQSPSPTPDGDLGNGNTAEGAGALNSLTTGAENTAIGAGALQNNTVDRNTADGVAALQNNTTGSANTATGSYALANNATGSGNTADGFQALINNSGDENTATGFIALTNNTTGYFNTATGGHALQGNTTGSGNTATGYEALANNTFGDGSGSQNTADGWNALQNNTTGNGNTANGNSALQNNTTGGSNIALGNSAGSSLTTGDNNIDIGNQGVAGESGYIRIGTTGTQTNAYVAGIYTAMVPKGLAVLVDSTGHLGTKSSSERFKDAIKPMDKASEAILALKPVTFHYKKELDPESIPQFGLVAEEVAKVNPDLVARDDQGKVYTVRYDAVNAMLLNEFLKEHREVQEQKATITQLKDSMKVLTASLKEQAAQIRKVNNKVELSKPAPQMVGNNQ